MRGRTRWCRRVPTPIPCPTHALCVCHAQLLTESILRHRVCSLPGSKLFCTLFVWQRGYVTGARLRWCWLWQRTSSGRSTLPQTTGCSISVGTRWNACTCTRLRPAGAQFPLFSYNPFLVAVLFCGILPFSDLDEHRRQAPRNDQHASNLPPSLVCLFIEKAPLLGVSRSQQEW